MKGNGETTTVNTNNSTDHLRRRQPVRRRATATCAAVTGGNVVITASSAVTQLLVERRQYTQEAERARHATARCRLMTSRQVRRLSSANHLHFFLNEQTVTNVRSSFMQNAVTVLQNSTQFTDALMARTAADTSSGTLPQSANLVSE